MADPRKPPTSFSPLQTPTTPTSAHLPGTPSLSPLTTAPSLNTATVGSPFDLNSPLSPTFITPICAMVEGMESSNNATRRRNSSIISSPTSPLESTLSRTLAMRPRQTASPTGVTLETMQFRIETDTWETTAPPTKKRKVSKTPLPPPPYHLTIRSRRSSRPRHSRTAAAPRHPAFAPAVEHLSIPLVPLVSVTNGLAHPDFPTSLLQYHLLTHEQVDSLAQWYHQVDPPVAETWRYPCPVPSWMSSTTDESRGAQTAEDNGTTSLTTKRRRWGRFMGLRGCESPTASSSMTDEESEESFVERMEREFEKGLERRREMGRLAEKGWRGRW